MSSNSIRISADLFAAARDEAELLSRSTAQQIEHWAKIGRAVEEAGLTAAAAKEIVRASGLNMNIVQVSSEKELWDRKRQRQARDIASIKSGNTSARSMSWFTREMARGAKVKNAPY